MPEPKATPVAETPKPKTFTNWKAFEQAKLVPATIKCEAYRPVFQHDASCHSNLLFTVETLQRHIDGDHGGGFRFFLKQTDGKPSPLWKALEEAGLEAHDFRCEICDKQLRFHPSSIIPHLKAHGGKTRRVLPGGVFNMVLSKGRPEIELTDEDEDVASA